MNNRNRISGILFFLAVLLQVVFLFSLLVKKEIDIRTGRKIVVRTIPVDPRSLFRGDYITLNYEFSRIDLNKVKHKRKYFYRGEKVHVKLARIDGDWRAVEVSDVAIKDTKPDEIVIRGSVEKRLWSGKTLEVIYGIESYFVPEGEGKYIEREISHKRVKVELSINREGYASVRKIFIDGKEVKFR